MIRTKNVVKSSRSVSSFRNNRSFSSSAATKGYRKMGPAAKILIRTHGLEQKINQIPSSGKGGRILKSDVLLYIQNPNAQRVQTQKPSAPFTATTSSTTTTSLISDQDSIPHQWITAEIQIDNIKSLQNILNAKDQPEKKDKLKLSLNDFIVKACAMSLRQVPLVNSLWVNGEARPNPSVNILATSLSSNGQIVPTLIRDADRKGLYSITKEIQETSASPSTEINTTHADASVGTFMVMNVAELGLVELCEVIAPQQSGVLTIGRAQKKPVSDEKSGKMSSADVVKITLACDSRIVTPQVASTFLDSLSRFITQPQLLM